MLHAGPSPKAVWVWPEDSYSALVEGRGKTFDVGRDDRCFDYEDWLGHATRLTVHAGGALFIPRGDFHVFRNVGCSSFVGISFLLATASAMLAEAITSLFDAEDASDLAALDCGDPSSQVEALAAKRLARIEDLPARLAAEAGTNCRLRQSNGHCTTVPIV
ncbi:hypothetical protein B2A_07596, partial [mine drainage metagenome]